jgi:hypothetical protein
MSKAAVILRDVVGLAGAASITYGAWLFNPASGFVVGGFLAVAGALALGRADQPAPPPNGDDA